MDPVLPSVGAYLSSPVLEPSDRISAIYDFVYLDQTRIETYYGQLIDAGVLKQTTISGATSGKTTVTGKVDVRLLAYEKANATGDERKIERTYDARMTLAIDTLARPARPGRPRNRSYYEHLFAD